MEDAKCNPALPESKECRLWKHPCLDTGMMFTGLLLIHTHYLRDDEATSQQNRMAGGL